MTKNILQHQNFAIACLLYSATCWGLIWYPLRIFDHAGMNGIWASLVMYLVLSMVVLPWLIKHYRLLLANRFELSVLAFAAGVTNVAFVVALIEGEVMRVMLLFYLSPIWTIVLGRWWLGEQLSAKGMALFMLAIMGSAVMLWNPEMGLPWPQGLADWLALTAGIAFAVNNVMARKLADLPLSIKTSVVWWGVMVVALVLLVWQSYPVPHVSNSIWLGAALLGLVFIGTMTLAVIYGVGQMPVYRSAVIMLFELIVGAISAWLLTEETMTALEWCGGALIMLSAYGVATLEPETTK